MIKYHYRAINFIKIFIVFVVCIPQTIIFAQKNSQPKKASITLYSGLKLPESSDFNETDFGFWIGITLDVPLGANWSLEPDLNYWKAKIYNHPVLRSVNVLGGSLFLAHTFKMQNFALRFAGGFGLGSEANSYSLHDRNTIILISFEANGLIDLLNQINLVPKIRYQVAAALGAHPTGESFQSFLIGLGIQYKFTINRGTK